MYHTAEEALRLLRARQPGNDGGKRKKRHKRGAYDHDRLERAPADTRDRLLDICMRHLTDKEEGIGLSERAFDCGLNTIWHVLRHCTSPVDRLVASLLPLNFKSCLSMLEECGLAKGFLSDGMCLA